MESIYTQVDKNKYKTFALMLAFFFFIVFVGYVAAAYFDNFYLLIFAFFGALFGNVFSYWFSDKIALKLSGAKPADENEYKDLHRLLENLSITAGLPKPKLYIIDDPAPNAFATGRNKEHAAVAITSGLVNTLNKAELEGVLAHELSHIGNRDVLVMTVAVTLVGFVGMLVDVAWRISVFSDSKGDRNPITFWIWLFVIVFAPLIAKLMQLAISRKREFLADASAAMITRYPEGLANALLKISSYDAPMKRASTATAHLFISSPFGGGKTKLAGFMSKLFSTHPPVKERVEALLGKSKSV